MSLRSIGLAVAVLLLGCALPPPPETFQNFIPSLELDTLRYYKEGLTYFSKSRYADAEASFRKALYLAPGTATIEINLANVLEREGLYEEASGFYEALLTHDPLPENITRAQLFVGLAHVYLSENKFPKAIEYYKAGLDAALDIGDFGTAASVARTLSVVSFRIGDEEAARCYSQHGLVVSGGSRDEMARYVRSLIAFDEYRSANDELINYLQQGNIKQDGEFLHLLGMASWGLGDITKTIDYEREALDLARKNPLLLHDVKLTQYLAKQVLATMPPAAGASATPTPTSTPANVKEDADKQLVQEGLVSLYWPIPMVEEYQRELLLLESEQP